MGNWINTVPYSSTSFSRGGASSDRTSGTANHISVVVSDDDSEEPSRTRIRVKKKRRKADLKDRGGLARTLRRICKWWAGLLFLPAIALLCFEIFSTARYRNATIHRPGLGVSLGNTTAGAGRVLGKGALKPEEEGETNLNRLDMPTRSVNGVREPCLKLLASDDVEHLEFPIAYAAGSHVKRLTYNTLENRQVGDNDTTLTQFETGGQNFNLFTGNQTLHERKESFKVHETMVVHCGFYSENGGFDIDFEDKRFMNNCRAVVSTCTFGGGDDLYQPIGMLQTSLKKVCYVAFWDEVTLLAQEEQGKRLDENRKIGIWRIIVVLNLPFTDQRLNGKIPKMLGHRLFPQARYSIWVDSKSQFRRDPIGVFEALLWRTNSLLAISEHGARSCVYDEGKAIIRKHKATPEEVDRQLMQYKLDGFPKEARFDGHKALAEASVIVREHTPVTNLFMCLWFNEVVRFTSRDQLSFPYVLKKLQILHINMFPVCTRRALVNSMGHKHKAKPLMRQTRTLMEF